MKQKPFILLISVSLMATISNVGHTQKPRVSTTPTQMASPTIGRKPVLKLRAKIKRVTPRKLRLVPGTPESITIMGFYLRDITAVTVVKRKSTVAGIEAKYTALSDNKATIVVTPGLQAPKGRYSLQFTTRSGHSFKLPRRRFRLDVLAPSEGSQLPPPENQCPSQWNPSCRGCNDLPGYPGDGSLCLSCADNYFGTQCQSNCIESCGVNMGRGHCRDDDGPDSLGTCTCLPGWSGRGSDCDTNDVGYDNDRDGFTENQGDCNDLDAKQYPGNTEVPGNGVDENCNGMDDDKLTEAAH